MQGDRVQVQHGLAHFQLVPGRRWDYDFISEKDSLSQDMKTGRVKNTPSLNFQLLFQFIVLRMVKNTDQFDSVFHT